MPVKNIQIFDGADNCVYDIFQVTDEEFQMIFPNGTDIAFIDEVKRNLSEDEFEKTFKYIWDRRIKKVDANGIHGILFYELEKKKKYYPTRKDEEATNPNGSSLR